MQNTPYQTPYLSLDPVESIYKWSTRRAREIPCLPIRVYNIKEYFRTQRQNEVACCQQTGDNSPQTGDVTLLTSRLALAQHVLVLILISLQYISQCFYRITYVFTKKPWCITCFKGALHSVAKCVTVEKTPNTRPKKAILTPQ